MRNSFLLILLCSVLIASIGIVSIYSSTRNNDNKIWQGVSRRQIIWVFFGILAFLLASNLNYRRFWDWTYFLYGLIICFLLLVFSLGVIRAGAQRWLKFFWFNFQPSEFTKLIMVIFLSRYFSKKSANDMSLLSSKFGVFKGFILPFIFTAIPAVLIIEQPDLGSGLMIMLLFIAMIYVAGVKFRYIAVFLFIALLFCPLAWHVLRDYQKERLMVFLNPNLDPLGAGYTIIQSKIAIGSGGILGKGWLAGTQSQLNFLPESHTDFIFATFSEQWGFIGGCLVLFLYYLLIRQGILIGKRTKDNFGRIFAFGISIMLSLQIFINIAMNLGFAPVVGLPLPLMSYGGSSMLLTFISLGILVNIDKTRTVF